MIIGTRGSQLALWQARWVQSQIEGAGILTIKTSGDRFSAAALPEVGGKGLFTKEIEEALLDGRADVAVHSLKDLPTEMDLRLIIAAVPRREDVRDALVGHTLATLPPGARVGTGSPRRAAQLRYIRPDLAVESIRGNVDTRLRKLDEGQYDAIVLAAAGLRRLGLGDRIAEYLSPEIMCPAVGQGALGIQCRAADSETLRRLAALEDPGARAEVSAERALLAELGGGCRVPIGGSARLEGNTLRLTAVVASPDGVQLVRAAVEGPVSDPAALGRQTARDLLARGAARILPQGPVP
jgi:hydroxymethylbilane synthase